jgi:hypothetical protein
MNSSNNSLEFDNGTPPLTEREFFEMIEAYKQNNKYNDDGIERKNRMNFDPKQGLEGLFGNEIEGHYNELGGGYAKGNSNNGTYKVTTQNEAGEEIPYFVKFVGNNIELKRFKDEKRHYTLQDINVHDDLLRYMQDCNLYEKALQNKNNRESITEDASKVINFIKEAIENDIFFIEDGGIKMNSDYDEKKLNKIIKKGVELNLLSLDIDQGKRTSSKGYLYNTKEGISSFNTMADMHWQNILAQIFDEKNPYEFSHDKKSYKIAFTPIRKITTDNGKIFITKGTNKKVWNKEYNKNVLQIDQRTDSGNIIQNILDPKKIFNMCGINDMHFGNVGSKYDKERKTWEIDAFDIRHQYGIIECIKDYNKNVKFNGILNNFYSRLFSRESIEKICNYLKDKNMKYETKSYMNDILKELSEVKKYLESRNIIMKNGVEFPKILDEAKKFDLKRYDSQKSILSAPKVNNWLSHQSSRKSPKLDIKEQLNNNLGTLYARYTKRNGINNNQYNPYQKIKPNPAEAQAMEVVGNKIKTQRGLDQTQYLKFR